MSDMSKLIPLKKKMTARNNITGAEIKSQPFSAQGRDNWEDIFGKKSAYEWMAFLYGRDDLILDPDGWRENDGVELETPITKAEFNRRFNLCTTYLLLRK